MRSRSRGGRYGDVRKAPGLFERQAKSWLRGSGSRLAPLQPSSRAQLQNTVALTWWNACPVLSLASPSLPTEGKCHSGATGSYSVGRFAVGLQEIAEPGTSFDPQATPPHMPMRAPRTVRISHSVRASRCVRAHPVAVGASTALWRFLGTTRLFTIFTPLIVWSQPEQERVRTWAAVLMGGRSPRAATGRDGLRWKKGRCATATYAGFVTYSARFGVLRLERHAIRWFLMSKIQSAAERRPAESTRALYRRLRP